jgi:hypothetical protein
MAAIELVRRDLELLMPFGKYPDVDRDRPTPSTW